MMKTNVQKINFFENNNNPLILDGAMGSYIQQKGFETHDTLWTTNINISNPEVIIQIHKEYINAGADIITTNTFRTNPAALKKSGLSNPKKYVRQAVNLAFQASEGMNILIAGSNAPAEDCYVKQRTLSNYELELNHKNHIDLLIDNGVDFVLNETQSHFDELRIICDHCDKNKLAYVISLYFTNALELLSGESLNSVLNYLKDHNAIAIGFNCISPELFMQMIGSTQLPQKWGYYLNCGRGQLGDKNIKCGIEPNEYIQTVEKSMTFMPVFIGSCCGSNPAHTKKIREFIYE